MMLSKSQRKRIKRKAKQEVRAIESRALVPVVAKPLAVAPSAPKSPARKQPRRQRGGVASNPYLATLMDPDGFRGVKIPDEVCVPTGTWTYEIETALATSANGELVVLFNPRVLAGSGVATVAGSAFVYCGNANYTTFTAVANPSISGVIGRLRPVSACIKAYSTSSPLNISGVASSFVIPCGTEDSNTLTATLSSITGWTSLQMCSVNHAAQGGYVRWAISDPSELEFEAVNTTGTTAWTYTAGVLTGQGNGTAIGIAFNGLPATSNVRVTVVANYEFIPSNDTQQFVSAEPSPQNKSWMERAARYFSSSPKTYFAIGKMAGEMLLPFVNSLANGSMNKVAMSSLKGLSGLLM